MRFPALIGIALVLGSYATRCTPTDTGSAKVWPRLFEPRLSIRTTWHSCLRVPPAGDRVVGTARCDDATPLTQTTCIPPETPAEAAELLESPACTDAAVDALEKFAATNSTAVSDLSAAYYVRAQRDDAPIDLLRAYEAAERALRSKPQPAAAWFNRALAIEALGLAPEAAAAWDEAAKHERSREWADEARARRDRLRHMSAVQPPVSREPAATKAALALYAETSHADVDRLSQIATEAQRLGYRSLAGRALEWRGLDLMLAGDYVSSLDSYTAALTVVTDRSQSGEIYARRFGVRRLMGDSEGAFAEALVGSRLLPWMAPVDRGVLLRETAATAEKLGFENAAWIYADAAVRDARSALAAVPSQPLEPGRLQHSLASALRRRAGVEIALNDNEHAQTDVREASRITGEETGGEFGAALQARIAEVEGQSLLRFAPRRAADAFTRALTSSRRTDFPTFVAALYAERADAEQNAGDTAAAQRDRVNALATLHAEERALIGAHPKRDSDIWLPYFSRFRDTYSRLIDDYMRDGRSIEALRLADRARAFEVLAAANEKAQEPTDVSTLQRMLPPGTFVIEYFIADKATYVWIVSSDAVVPGTLRVSRADIERWSNTTQRAAKGVESEETLGGVLRAAYDGLLAEPLATIGRANVGNMPPRLVIVPDGALHGLPFAALYDSDTRQFLIQKATVSIAPSAALYTYALRRDRDLATHRASSALLVGNPEMNPRLAIAANLPPLPGAEKEVREIAAVYAPNAHVWTGAAATADALLTGARDNAIIHVAAHAVVNAHAPAQSALLLAASARSDGSLQPSKFVDPLKHGETRLVVLAACSSAGGRPVGAEGVAPLVRPLIAAGVPAVVGTLWDIHDATAKELLVSFHQYYRHGRDAADALRFAQLDLLRRNDSVPSVLEWAPYQVIGHSSSPFAPTHK